MAYRPSVIRHNVLVPGPQSVNCKIAKRLTANIVCMFDSFVRRAEFPAFWYSEQRTKTFISNAVMNLSSGIALHEPPATRKGSRKHKRIEDGKADYWFEYRDKYYFLEVKQIWQEMNKENPGVIRTLKRHKKCWEQVKCIDKASRDEWYVSNVMALTVAPFETNWKIKRGRNNWIELHDYSKTKLAELSTHIKEQISNIPVSLFSLVKLGSGHQGNQEWQQGNDKKVNYHFLLMLWTW